MAESFFNLLKRERIRLRIHKNRLEASQNAFNEIGMFYSPKRKYVRKELLSPVAFDRQQISKTEVA